MFNDEEYPEENDSEDLPMENDSDPTVDSDGGGDDIILEVQQAVDDLRQQLGVVIVGQDEVIDQLLLSLLAGGHCLLVGVPGLAKTLLISTLARSLTLSFNNKANFARWKLISPGIRRYC